LSLCLASASVVKALSIVTFTLVWTHSIEKVDWQEDWRVTPQGLLLTQARVKGSGAGMEPPPGARLINGWYQWPLANGGCVMMEIAGRCRIFSGIRSVSMSRP
jgi:hypothetical protein